MAQAAPKETMNEKPIEEKQIEAQAWFRELRDQICSAFEGLEDALESGPHAGLEAGRFEREVWDRNENSEKGGARSADRASHEPAERSSTVSEGARAGNKQQDPYAAGGGEISMMKGRVFEKVGVNISTVTGKFSEQFQREMPGGAETPYYWASGISLVAHMRSPLVPAVHMNTRMICLASEPWTDQESESRVQSSEKVMGARKQEARSADLASHEPAELRSSASEAARAGNRKTKTWFGGGADLNPMFEVAQDTADFHNAFKAVCDAADPAYYEAFKAWCDEYFYIPHRGEARGVGGIFYDYLGFDGQSLKSRVQSSESDDENGANRGQKAESLVAEGVSSIAQDSSPERGETQNNNAKNFGGNNAHRGPKTQAGMQLTMADEKDWETRFDFTKAVGEAFRDIYPEIARRHIHEEWNEEQRAWQLEKRGRYAEYNLLLDRGTRFGLMTGGNPKAILMSLPPEATWK